MKRFVAVVCLLMMCGTAFGGENFERMLELYRQSSYADFEQRQRDYEELQEARRANKDRHLPAGTQFDFARESFRKVRADGPGETDANGCAWTSVGPTNLNGRVSSIAIDPTNNQRIYAATVGGLWRSFTAGRRWERVSDDFLATVFGAIAVNPGAPHEILAGGGDSQMGVQPVYNGDGIWRSTSSGAPGTWSKVLPAKFDNSIVYRIIYDPAPPHDVYVAAKNGVWIGTHDANGNLTFDRIDGFDATTHDIAVDFSVTPRIIYAGVRESSLQFGVGIWKWQQATSWQPRSNGIPLADAETFSIALSQSHPNILYTKVSQRSDQTLIGLFKTVTAAEGAKAWEPLPVLQATAVPDEIMGWYNTMLEVDPTDPDRVYAGGIEMWMSTNGGTTWDMANDLTDAAYPLRAHADFHTLAFDPLNPKIIYVGNDGGIDRSTDLSKPTWHWTDVSHGMVISMFYFMTSNRAYPSLLAGGMQDNGTGISFGNRTWYNPGGCDGFDVGSDAKNPDTLYANCNNNDVIDEFTNPVPGTIGGPKPGTFFTGAKITFANDPKPGPPVITDIVTAKAALAGSGTCGQKTIVKTVDGVKWEDTFPNLPLGGAPIALASAPSASFQTYLAAVAYKPPPMTAQCNVQGTAFSPYVIRSDDGGTTWTPVSGLPSNREPSSLVFDPNDKNRSFVTYRNGGERIYMSTGGPYVKIGGAFPNLIASDVRKVVVDPFDANVLYAATSMGVYRGVLTPGMPFTASWTPFNEGLPDGMEINDVWADPQTGILSIGSFGFGAFRRDIRKDANCKARMLVVRDCVYDDGREQSPCGVPDAEHPIVDVELPQGTFYKPDDTVAGKAWWWTSRDIRIDVPSKAPYRNRIDNADSVELELCPSSVSNCPAGSIIDSPPQAYKDARVYVQVTNRGVEPVQKTRVIALWNASGAKFEKLPETFWTQTFPADAPCGALDPTTGWQLVDPTQPCRTISSVKPIMPEVARFDWKVPFNADGGATMMTIVESPEDTLDPSIRKNNVLAPSVLVPGSRHIALRNVRITPFDVDSVREPKLWPLDLLKLPQDILDVELVMAKPDLRGSVRIVLPAGLSARAGEGSVRRTRVTEEELVRKLQTMGLDPANAWELSSTQASLFVDMRPGQRVTAGVIATPEGTATSRVSIVERSRGEVVGGSVMLLRPE
jgi:hypothetical protein